MNVRVCAGIGVLLLTCTRRKLVKAIDRPRPIEKVRPGIETNSLSGPSALDGNARFVVSRTHT